LKKLLREIRTHQSALVSLTEANLKTSVATTRLGWFWWIINPLVMMGIYYFFVNIVMRRGGDGYPLFVLTGLVAWQIFNNALIGTSQVVANNRLLIKQVALPIPTLTLIPVIVQMIFGSIGLILVLVWNVKAAGLHSFGVVYLVLLTGMLSYGIGLFLAVFNVYLGDTAQMLSYILRMGFFLTPVLFPADYVVGSRRLPEIFKILFELNPMTILITSFRQVLLDGHMFNLGHVFFLTVFLFLLIQLGLLWVRKHASQIVKMI
jgi:ABC-type polysaccharide/polyol phosphate export permease